MVPCIGRSLHADVVVRHWNTVGNIVETEWFVQKTEPLLKFGAHSGQLRHSLSGAVKFKVQQKGRLFSW